MSKVNYEHDIAAFAGYITDNKELLQCTSGGLATAMSKKMIEIGGYVAGVRYSDDFRYAKYEITNDKNELDKFKGSKYIEVETGTIYKDVKKLLDDGENVLFFGVPCMVGAMKFFLKKDYNNLILVELICHGPTNPKVHLQFIEYLENKYKSNIIDFSVRKKLGKWNPSYLYAEFANGKKYKKNFYDTEYGYAFCIMSKPSCYCCKFKGDNRTGDIMIGDFWGVNSKDEFWNKFGVSAILVHSQEGLDFLKSVEGVKLYETTFERIVEENEGVVQASKPSPYKEKFEQLFVKYGLFYAVNNAEGIKGKIKRLIPHEIRMRVKKILN